MPSASVKNTCQKCEKVFLVAYKLRKQKYCSSKCYHSTPRNIETLEKMSASHKGIHAGIKHPMYGKKHSEETKKTYSEMRMGALNSMYGKKHSEETRKKIGILSRNKIMSEEARIKVSNFQKGRVKSLEERIRLSKSLSGIKKSDEHKRRISETLNGRYVGDKNPNWLGGDRMYGIDFNELLKEKIRNRDERICKLCISFEKETKLSVHHIDYNKMNNQEDNLISLCVSCHGMTNKNRGYWEEFLKEKMNNTICQVSQITNN